MFDLLSSYSGQAPVTIGHTNGVITVEPVEPVDDYREAMRILLARAVPTGSTSSELFGDERASYSDAIDRQYREAAPDGWESSYISEYTTMQPWEDFAE